MTSGVDFTQSEPEGIRGELEARSRSILRILDRARGLGHKVFRDLTRDLRGRLNRDLALTSESVLAAELVLTQVRDFNRTFEKTIDQAADRVPRWESFQDRIRFRARDRIPDIVRAYIPSPALESDLGAAHDLSQDLERTLSPDFGLGREVALVFDREVSRARIETRILTQLLAEAYDMLSELREFCSQAGKTQTSHSFSLLIPRLARRAIYIEARILPHKHRSRYIEELQAELYDLAHARATKIMLVLYALQQLRRAWQLRAALEAPNLARFHKLHRTACWILASDWRTWGLLGPLMAFAVVNVHLQQGWGSALFTTPSIVVFYAGVEWLRKRWGVEVKPWKRGRKRPEAK